MVRIDGTLGAEPYGLPSDKGKCEKPADSPASEKAGETHPEWAVSSSLAPWIRQAAAVADVDVRAVEEAQRALGAGQLDTPDAIRRAAQAILELGL